MVFEPNALIPIYPRDYFFLEDGQQCMGFAYLGSRIILGGIFMRNFDVQFSRDTGIVKMVRADCSPKENFNFSSYYIHHFDHRSDEERPTDTVPNKENQRPKSLQESDIDLFQWLTFFIFCGLVSLFLIYSLFLRRYRKRSTGLNEFQRIENAIEI